MKLQIKRLTTTAILPTRNYSTDSGLDLYADIDNKIEVPPLVTYKLASPLINTDFSKEEETYKDELVKLSTNLNRVLIPTGIAIKLPEVDCWPNPTPYETYEATIRPRSGLAVKQGISVHLGTIDNQYVGEIKVLVYNFSNHPIEIEPGMKIAQLVIQKVHLPEIIEVEELGDTERGVKGFGSSGI